PPSHSFISSSLPRRLSPMLTVLITGGSRGIGAATVRSFASAGYRTAFFYRSSESAAQTLANETGAYAIQCDIRDSASTTAACQQATRLLGHIDVLVNNAGIAQQKLFTDITDDDWRAMLDTNLSGAFYASRAVLPDMISRRYGRIINVGSIWGQVGASCEVNRLIKGHIFCRLIGFCVNFPNLVRLTV
ncbi:MAG: SDR family NAD(P)-dependent oxidoreductase, partial [Clostridia bacterium]|nr:SDR family NAD(P)-dependent oxidoreductase [Clostridia bacterium]